MLGRLGVFMGRRRWWVIAAWVMVLVAAAPLAKNVTHNLTAGGFDAPGSPAVWADNQLQRLKSLPTPAPLLVERASYGQVAEWVREAGIPSSSLHRIAGTDAVVFPPGPSAASLAGFKAIARRHGATLLDVNQLSVGQKVINDTKSTLAQSLPVALPLLLILLLLVFGTVVAAALPLGVAAVGTVVALAVIDLLENSMTLSAYLTDIVSFLALGVGVDYALFISVRYRQALERHGGDRMAALDEAMAHAGRSVLFSGLAVALALSTLALGGNAYWRGIAVGGAITVGVVLITTHTLLPAVLGALGPRINWGRVPIRAGRNLWHRIGDLIRTRPGWAFLAAVLLLGIPATQGPAIRMSTPANLAVLLPAHDPLREAVALAQRVQGPGTASPLVVAMELPDPVTSPAAWSQVETIAARLRQDPAVRSVESPTALAPPNVLARAAQGAPGIPPALAAGLRGFAAPAQAPHLAVIYVTSRQGPDAAATVALVERIDRQLHRWLPGRQAGVGGITALLHGFNRLTAQRLPRIIAAVAAVAFGVLLLATGSVWQALLGVGFDGLVALATAGVMVATVQRGSLGLLPLSPDSSITPLVFVLLFGLSMDYEVILLHRVQEFFARGRPPREAAAIGVTETGGMITGAGMIMVVVFLALILSPLEIMQTLAIGMTAAILLDTWLVRTLLVPSSIVWLGRHAFWPWGPAPRPR
jgi:uncharacterized membrane protein YdfJ with MMPL/SSD domain